MGIRTLSLRSKRPTSLVFSSVPPIQHRRSAAIVEVPLIKSVISSDTKNMVRKVTLCLAIVAMAAMIDICTSQGPEPRTWTGMVGKDPQEVKATIEAEGRGYVVVILPMNSPVTMDYRPWRVRIFHNAEGKVCHDPHTG